MAEVRKAVIVCDHHPLIRAGIRAALAAERDLTVVADLPDWPAATPFLRAHPSALLVIERSLFRAGPGGPPGSATVISADTIDAAGLLALVSRGVRAIVRRSGPGEDVVRAARSVAHGQGFVAPEFVSPLLSALRVRPPEARPPRPAGPPRADGPPPGAGGPPGPGLCRLTTRERDVLRLLALGARNREIAHALGIGERTVKFHVSNLLTKTQLRTRAQLIARLADPTASRS